MIAASNHILGSAWYLYEVYVDIDIKIHINLQRKLLRVTCYHGASSMTTHEKHDKLNHIHLCLGLINIHSKCFHRTYTGYKCTCKNKHTLEFWSTTNCRWYAEQLMVNSRLRLFPPLLLSERQRQNALPQQIITYKYDKEVCTKKHFSYAWGVYPYQSDMIWEYKKNHIHILEEYDGMEVIRFCLYLQHDDHETASSGELGEQPNIDMDEKCWEPINSI